MKNVLAKSVELSQ